MTTEYRVRPVVRYIVTRYTAAGTFDGLCGAVGSAVVGEFHHEREAELAVTALSQNEASFVPNNAAS